VYTMAYTFGSCKNMCGKMVQDCNCSIACKSRGNCCTDYESVGCDAINSKALSISNDQCSDGCDFCVNNVSVNATKCYQCKDRFYLFEGSCYLSCPVNTSNDDTNYLCVKKQTCNVQNCEQCLSSLSCKTCQRGYFLSNNQCVDSCPVGYRADRITWSCLEPPVFAWYWVYPSRGSCKSYCGVVVQSDWDCSCLDNCFLWGNCCQDIDYYCENLLFWRKNLPNRRKALTTKNSGDFKLNKLKKVENK